MANLVKSNNEEKTFYFPITINQEEDWTYWWEAKIFEWCFSSWKTLEEYGKNMTDAIQSYADSIREWFFEPSNIWVLKINIDKNGKIKASSLKRLNEDSYKILSWN